MKILWFTNTPCGASEQLSPNSQGGGWLSSLEKQFATSGKLDLHICFHWDTNISPFSNGGVTYHPVRRYKTKQILLDHFLGGYFQQNPVQAYLEVISRVKPDLIHVHGTEEAFGLIQSATDIPVIISIQGILSNYLNKYFSGISLLRFLLSENIFNHVRLKSILTNYLIFRTNAKRERIILSTVKHIIGRTEWDRRSTAVLAPNACYYHGDEILRSPFYDGTWSRYKFSQPFRIVTVLSGAPYKGFETIVQVSKILLNNIGFNFIWSVVGLSQNDPVVRVVNNWLGEQSQVQLLGTRTGDAIRDILLDSDVFCQVSHIENSPNGLCEAMLLGMPIIASFAGGTDSILCAGREGILVQDGDSWSIAGAILELSRDLESATKMGIAAKYRAMARHNPNKIASELLLTYKQVIGEGE